jgi:hypothetical protein
VRSASGTVAPCTRRRARLALPNRGRRAPEDGSDLVEGHGEHVVQHEGDPLGRSQRVEDHQEREADRVGEQGFVLGVGRVLGARGRFWQLLAERVLTPGRARAQHVQTHPCDDRLEPPAEVLDTVRAGAAEAEPGFLDGVVRLAHRSEHPVGHRPEMGPVGLEALGQPVVLVHRSHPRRSRSVMLVTNRSQPM